jgi:hypothetical protein
MNTDYLLFRVFIPEDAFELKAGVAEVEEEGDFLVGGFEVIDALGGVDFVEGGDGFELEYDGPFDEDIGVIVPDENSVIVDGDGELGLDLQASFAEFVGEGILIDFFEEAAAEGIGDFDRAANDLFGQLFMNHRVLLKNGTGQEITTSMLIGIGELKGRGN